MPPRPTVAPPPPPRPSSAVVRARGCASNDTATAAPPRSIVSGTLVSPRAVAIRAAGEVRRDRQPRTPDLPAPHLRVGFAEARLSRAERLDLRAGEHDSSLPRLQEVVVMSRPRVAGDGAFVHRARPR